MIALDRAPALLCGNVCSSTRSDDGRAEREGSGIHEQVDNWHSRLKYQYQYQYQYQVPGTKYQFAQEPGLMMGIGQAERERGEWGIHEQDKWHSKRTAPRPALAIGQATCILAQIPRKPVPCMYAQYLLVCIGPTVQS